MEHASLHARAREKGVNPLIYWLVRGVLQPFFHVYFRLSRIGREHIPDGPVIFASNHRSFLDPFIIATIARRPLYYVAKKELFRRRFAGWLLNTLGAFPVRRGKGDADMIETAKAILDRGDAVLIFPEGTRIRPGALGRPRRGVGRLALETGAPVVPVAVIGTEAVRKGWRIRPHKVRVRIGRALTFPQVQAPVAHARRRRHRPHLAVRDAPVGVARRAPAAAPRRRHRRRLVGHRASPSCSRAPGLEVDLGCRTADQAEAHRRQRLQRATTCPDVELPESITVMRAVRPRALAPRPRRLRRPLGRAAERGRRARRRDPAAAPACSCCPRASCRRSARCPPAFVAERVSAWAVGALAGPAHAAAALERRRLARGRRLGRRLRPPGHRRADAPPASTSGSTRDVVGVELAGCAKNAAALAAAAAAHAGPNAAGAAAGKVFAEIDALAPPRGAAPETFAGLAGAGDLVATVLAEGSRNRRAGEMLADGVPAEDIDSALGQTAEAVACVPLLAERVRGGGRRRAHVARARRRDRGPSSTRRSGPRR